MRRMRPEEAEHDRVAQAGLSITELVVTVAVLLAVAGLLLPKFFSFRAGAYNTMAMSALEGLARAEGSRFVMAGSYASCGSVAACAEQFPELRPNQELLLYAEADDDGFVAVAMHPDGGQKYVWDSRLGGLQGAATGGTGDASGSGSPADGGGHGKGGNGKGHGKGGGKVGKK